MGYPGNRKNRRTIMKKVVAKIIVLLLLAFFAAGSSVHAAEPANGNISAVVKEINKAKSAILVQAYSLTDKDIADALADAHKRGVRVQIILDKSSRDQKTSVDGYTRNAGIPTYLDPKHDIPGDRTFIIDRQIVITDSFNFTAAAGEKGTGNLLILNSYELAKMYIDNWNKHRSHSGEYTGNMKTGGEL
jgi:phosphatidylserine/phosphatidylglycerophosphate/cardiolipin synthase-like enzyme